MRKIIFIKSVIFLIVIILSCLLYSVVDDKITTGAYSYTHDLKQKYFSYPSEFKEKYVFLNIDDKAYERLDNPDFTPPKIITKIVRLANFSQPKILILDVDLRPSIEDNRELIEFLKKHDKFPILLADVPFNFPRNKAPFRMDHKLDAVVEKNPNLIWVSTLYTNQNDNVVRQSRYFNIYCWNEKIIARPTVAFAVKILSKFGLDKTNALLKSVKVKKHNQCDISGEDNINLVYVDPETKKVVNFKYNYGYNINFLFAKNRDTRDKDNNLVVIEHSVKGLVGDVEIEDISINEFRERIIIIGGTNSINNNIFTTSIGSMHGPYLILNAIESALNIKYKNLVNFDKNQSILILYAVLIGVVLVFFRNTVLLFFSVSLVFLVQAVFDNTHVIALFTVLTTVLCVGFFIEVKKIVCRIISDISDFGWRFIFSIEVRESCFFCNKKNKNRKMKKCENNKVYKEKNIIKILINILCGQNNKSV